MIRALVAVVVCFVGLGAGYASADTAPQPSATGDITQFIAFVGAGPLAGPERERLANAVDAETRAHPDEVQKVDAALRKFLVALDKDAPLQRADLREVLRLKFEKLPADDVLRQILDRSDPVVMFDQSKNRLITEGTLAAWQRAGVWMAGILSVPQPGSDFIATQRAYVKTRYAALPDKEQDVIAHVERNYPAMVALFDHATAAKRADFVASARPQALDRAQFGIRLADAMGQFYDVALHQEFMVRLIGNMAVIDNGLLQAPMMASMIRNIGAMNAATNAGMAHMGAMPVVVP